MYKIENLNEVKYLQIMVFKLECCGKYIRIIGTDNYMPNTHLITSYRDNKIIIHDTCYHNGIMSNELHEKLEILEFKLGEESNTILCFSLGCFIRYDVVSGDTSNLKLIDNCKLN